MTSVLVHGAAGFVGQSLLQYLLQAGFTNLILVDRRPMPRINEEMLSSTKTNIRTYVSDCLLGVVNNEDVAIVISLAGLTDVDSALHKPGLSFDGNISIAVDLGEWMRQIDKKPKLIYLSTDEVLGCSLVPLPEDAPLKPTQPYAASKAAAELILHNYRDVYDLAIYTLRSCNLIGGRQRARKLIPITVKSLCEASPVPIFGNGNHLREWMSVEDLCGAILCLMHSSTFPQVFQAASGCHLSVREVVALVAEALDIEPQTRTVKDRLVHDNSYAMETGRLQNLGWKPRINPRAAITQAAKELATTEALADLQRLLNHTAKS